MRSDYRARGHAAWWAFLVHRVSGLALAAFLPLHFWALAQALEREAALDGFLAWRAQPAVEFAEWGVIVLLAAHLTAGLRVLALEFLPWRDWQKSLLAAAAGATLVVGIALALAL